MARPQRYIDNEDDSGSSYKTPQSLAATARRILLVSPIILFLLVLATSFDAVSNLTRYLRRNTSENEQYNGRYPHSLLTLFFPYTLLRDVVLDQPVDVYSDVPFFWYIHRTDEIIMKQVLTDCYGLDIIELDSMEAIEQAKRVNLAARNHKSSKKFVVTSPFIREAIQIFTPENFGRMFCFFRHPLDYDLHESLPTFPDKDNWLTRLLSNVHEGPIGFKQLGVAKHVVRETAVVGTMDKMSESIIRIGNYFGWELQQGSSDTCIDDIVKLHNPKEKWIDHSSQKWQEFYKANQYDAQLYEIARSTWRAQIQTIIPYHVQISRASS